MSRYDASVSSPKTTGFGTDVLEDTRADERLRVGVAHAQAENIANDIAETVRHARPEAVIELVAPLGAVVGTNTGPGGAGLVWAREPG